MKTYKPSNLWKAKSLSNVHIATFGLKSQWDVTTWGAGVGKNSVINVVASICNVLVYRNNKKDKEDSKNKEKEHSKGKERDYKNKERSKE